MKKNFLSLMILILTSCTSKSEKDILKNTHKEEYNILNENIKDKDEKEIGDSIKQDFLDTSKIKNSPIKIISAKLYQNEYSDHKDIKLTYKNLSKKDIKAIKFEWYCENVFDEPASGQYFFLKGIANGHTDIIKIRKNRF